MLLTLIVIAAGLVVVGLAGTLIILGLFASPILRLLLSLRGLDREDKQ